MGLGELGEAAWALGMMRRAAARPVSAPGRAAAGRAPVLGPGLDGGAVGVHSAEGWSPRGVLIIPEQQEFIPTRGMDCQSYVCCGYMP
jgi:hypothetical protein